jgi:hypothetical protein
MTESTSPALATDGASIAAEAAEESLTTFVHAGLASYFDLGCSYGLTDGVFRSDFRNPDPDIGLVGIRNPLGAGTTLRLDLQAPEVMDRWIREAVAQVSRPEMETGWNEHLGISREAFDAELRRLLTGHPVEFCSLTIYALGTVYLRLQLSAGLELTFLPGVLACMEYAAYRADVSDAIFHEAYRHAARALESPREDFVTLTRRPTGTPQAGAGGYTESNLFTSFTGVIVFTRPAGEGAVPQELLNWWDLSQSTDIDFEFHGHLHYSWATCLLQPRGEGAWTLEQELARPLTCIEIAHTALGVCEAFLRLSQAEINSLVESYGSSGGMRRSSTELNRLRSLALAVVNLTNLDRVTQSEEDQRYFRLFTESANLRNTKQLLSESLEVLFSVQGAEEQEERVQEQERRAQADDERARRETLLNYVVVILASLTLISVIVDAYNFVRDTEQLIRDVSGRAQLLIELVLALTLLVAVLLFTMTGAHRRRFSGRRRFRRRRDSNAQ